MARLSLSPLGRNIVRNTLSLGSVQVLTYLFPLILSPYLLRVLGLPGFGLMAFSQALAGYSGVVIDWGFNISATRQVAVARHDPDRLVSIYCDVMLAKVALCVATFGIFTLIAWNLPSLRPELEILLAANLVNLSGVLFPGWLFQGLEIMSRSAAIAIAGRIAATAAMFAFIHSPDDVLKALLIQSLVAIAAALLAFFSALAVLRRGCFRLSFAGAYFQLRQGLDLFLTTASISLYTVTNSVVLGMWAGKTQVGYFAPAEKITRAASDLIGTYGQSTFPAVEYAMANQRDAAVRLIRKSLLLVGSLGMAASLGLIAMAPLIVKLFFGTVLQSPVAVMRILAPLPLLIACSNIFAVQTLIPHGLFRQLRRIVFCAGLLNLVLLSQLVPARGAEGAALSVLFTEIFVTLSTGLLVHQRRLLASSVQQ